MFTLLSTTAYEQEIKRSRFLARAGPVADEQDARDFVAEHSVAGENPNCWAWRLGQTYRFSDDGVPGGSAGKPILQAIDGHDLDGIAVVVTRWFGVRSEEHPSELQSLLRLSLAVSCLK